MSYLLIPSVKSTLAVKKLIKLERSGRYEEALTLFGEDWNEVDFSPELPNAKTEQNAEGLLRYGSLIGFYGYRHSIAGSQERSRDLLTRAREHFFEPGNTEKVAECENYIALSYWRTGEFREALVWIDESLSRDLALSSDARLYSEVIKSLIFLSTGRNEENVTHCLAIESVLRKHGDAFLNGSLCTNLGLSFNELSRPAEAMRYLSLARLFHEKSRHLTYLGTVYNNLAQLYKLERRFVTAHESADQAIKLYKKLKDRTREASTWDTKAQIYWAEGKFDLALSMADRSIKMLSGGEMSADLAEAHLTRSKILLFADRLTDAILSLVDTVNITRVQNGDYAAKGVIDVFAAALIEKHGLENAPQSVVAGELELILPGSFPQFEDYKGVWIKTEKLSAIGVPRGSLVVVVPAEVRRGDLIAVAELDSKTVSCGFYDNEFGIVCLEAGDDDPELFDETKIKVLGKIVGVCRTGKDPEGKMVVEELSY
ncbi:hypothetical protein BH20ACI2_BH20ACI2_26490 [soil metagenome]